VPAHNLMLLLKGLQAATPCTVMDWPAARKTLSPLQGECHLMLFLVGLRPERHSHTFRVSATLCCFELACGRSDVFFPSEWELLFKIKAPPGLRRVGLGGLNIQYPSLQPAEHRLLSKHFSKMFPSVFRVLDSPGPRVGWGQNCDKTFLGQVELCKFYQDRCRDVDFH